MTACEERKASAESRGVWRLIRPTDLDTCRFADGLVVHDDLGASVMLLSPVAGELFETLSRYPAGCELATLTTELLGEGVEPNELRAVDRLLDGMRAQGLVQWLPL